MSSRTVDPLDDGTVMDDPSASRSYDETRRYDPTLFSSIAARVEIDMLDPMDGDGPEEFQDEHSLQGMGRNAGGGGGGGGKGLLKHRVFGTAEHKTYLKEGTRRRGRNAMIAIPAVLALTLLIGSIVYLELNDDGDDAPRGDSNARGADVVVQGGVQSPPATGGQAVLSAPWKGLAELCAEESIESLGNYERCKEECEPAACCHLPMGDVLSCLANNVESCAEYEEACQYLSHHSAQTADADTKKVAAAVEIPVPPGDMTELCKSTSLSTVDGYNDCAEACQAAECCTSKDCKPSNPELCGAYDPCSILTGTISSHPHSIQSTVKKECSTSALFDGEGVEECRYACRPAECCFADATDPQAPVRACLTDETEGWCSQYAPCHILPSLDDDGFDSHEEATNAIDDACQGNDKDMIKCVNLCSASVCCFEETEECWEEEGKVDFHCDHYAACAVVFSPFIGGVGDSAKTEEATAHVHTVTLDESDVDNEAADEAALAYDEAAIAAAVKIEAACLPDASGSLADGNVCRALCEQRSCCFRVTEECDKQMLAMDFHCELFAPCQAVMTNSDGENPSPIIVDRNDDRMDGTGGGGNVQVARPIAHDYHEDDVAAAIAIEAACSDESDQDECMRLCEDKACCFQDTEECIEEMADINLHCELFDVCGLVLGTPWDLYDEDGAGTGEDGSETAALGGTDPPEDEIAAACQAVEETHGVDDPAEIALCINLCKDKACCFPDEIDFASTDCHSDPDRKCSDFEQCREVFVAWDAMGDRDGGDDEEGGSPVAHPATGGNHPSEEDLRVACAAVEGNQDVDDPTEVFMCVSLCKDKACCFPDEIGGGPDDCRTDPDKNCAMQELCREVFNNLPIAQQSSPQMAMAQPTNAVLREIEENCATDSVSTMDGWEDCYDSCQFKRCCFEEDPDKNCELDGTEECPLYELCRVVFA